MPATLTTLRIRNLALVEELAWEINSGFTSVTGETGAGKSVILGALKLLIGERADKTLVRSGSEQCVVEASFNLSETASWDEILDQNGAEACADGELLLKRTVSAAGAGRQFVNGSPSPLALLKILGDRLVDLHGPHDHQSLFSNEQQMHLLDAFAQSIPARQAYAAIWKSLEAAKRELESLATDEAALERELDLLKHQVQEIESAELRAEEEVEVEARYLLGVNSRRLIEIGTAVQARLVETDSCVVDQLAETQRQLRDLERLDPAASTFAKQHEIATEGLRELAEDLGRYVAKLDLDPQQLAEMETRINLLQSLKRKYGSTLEEVIRFGKQAAERLNKINSRGDDLKRLEKQIITLDQELREKGGKLTSLRKSAAPKLSTAVCNHLKDLGFPKADFSIDLISKEPAASGMESVEFLFAPNPGEPSKPLRAIASSGEISRVMLAVKSALAAQDEVGLLVFDEIDANVGGEIAVAVGAKMLSLSKNRQVLCITHLPQVAAAADHQFQVEKSVKEGRTHSKLRLVKDDDRIKELARMLGGQSDSALAHAKALLEKNFQS